MPGSSSVAAQISPSERSTSLPTETSAGKADAARLAARTDRADHAAGMRGGEDAAGRQVRFVERGIGGEHRLVRRSTTPRLDGPTMRSAGLGARSRAAALRARSPSAPASAKPSASTVAILTPIRPHSATASIAASVGGHDVGVVGHFRQFGERRPGAFAQDALASRIDRIDAARHSPPAADISAAARRSSVRRPTARRSRPSAARAGLGGDTTRCPAAFFSLSPEGRGLGCGGPDLSRDMSPLTPTLSPLGRGTRLAIEQASQR